MADPVEVARRLADELLFPRALATDAQPVLPAENLDAVAAAGLYGLTGPASAGGFDADFGTVCAVVEALASGCLTTAFVWAQHIGAVVAVANSETPGVGEWLAPLCAGSRRAGLALAGSLPGPPILRARRRGEDWELTGTAPWVSGWGRIDVIHTAARTPEDEVLWTLVDASEDDATLEAQVLDLLAVRASATARVAFNGHVVAGTRVTSVAPRANGAPEPYVLRVHAALVLGLVERTCRLLGTSSFDDELVACRAELDAAPPHELVETMPAARAAISELALRATAALVAQTGSRSVLPTEHPQRLAREALFLAVYGARPEVRASLLERLRRATA